MNLCAYCGETASHRDHVPPVSWFSTRNRRHPHSYSMPWVWACAECNHQLWNLMLLTIEDRSRYLYEKYKQKYKKLLKSPKWTDIDLEELGTNLKQSIYQIEKQQILIKHRLSHLKKQF